MERKQFWHRRMTPAAIVVAAIALAMVLYIVAVVPTEPQNQRIASPAAPALDRPASPGARAPNPFREEGIAGPADYGWDENPMPRPVDEWWDELYPAASSGDVDAAYQLASILSRCRIIMRTVADVDPGYWPDFAQQLSPPGNDAAAAALLGHLRNCNADQQRLDHAAELMLIAADGGHVDAMMEFHGIAYQIFSNTDEEGQNWYLPHALRLLGNARNRGRLDAAMRIAAITRESEPITSYANSAYVIASLERGIVDSHPIEASSFIQRASRLMSVAQSSLSDSELNQARELAEELIAQCCQ